jgi:hypothetical protein
LFVLYSDASAANPGMLILATSFSDVAPRPTQTLLVMREPNFPSQPAGLYRLISGFPQIWV